MGQIILEFIQGIKKICSKWIQGDPLTIQGVRASYNMYKTFQNWSNWMSKVSNQLRICPGYQKIMFQVDTG